MTFLVAHPSMVERLRILRGLARVVAPVAVLAVLGACGKTGSSSDDGEPAASPEWVLRWNRIAIDASGFDHAHAGEQLGPGKSSRAMAIVHLAIFDALDGIEPRYASYREHPQPAANASPRIAIAQAARDTLIALYPAQASQLDAELVADLNREPDTQARSEGARFGHDVAMAILAERAEDRADLSTPEHERAYPISSSAGHWRPDPVHPTQAPLGAYWGEVAPFALASASQFRAPPPPSMASAEYAAAFEEVKRLGGDGVVTPTARTDEQTQIGIYWAYDGTPSLCAPPRLYNQITAAVASQQGTRDALELARLFALVNVAMADAGTAIWESKYHYDFWRPVTGIREADPGLGPSGAGDGNPLTSADPSFTPLGAPASNSPDAASFTPPFPAYPSGHAGFGGALFETLRNFYGTDEIAFSFVSDELNGVTVGGDGAVRPLVERHFDSLSDAEDENGQSRIYLGIHWRFDKSAGIAQGRAIADQVFATILLPRP
ncbi:MAG: chloroperoxidase [bacterium]